MGTTGILWFNLIVGVVLILIGRNFGLWVLSLVTGQPFRTNVNWAAGPKAGQEVTYPELQGGVIWSDASLFVFGIAIIVEALVTVIAMRRPPGTARALTTIGLLVVGASTALSLFACAKLFSIGVMPLGSALAAAYGGYMVAYLWRLRAAYAPRKDAGLSMWTIV